MRKPRESNRVSWATGSNLRQVHSFLPDNISSKVGYKLQDLNQAKTSSILHSSPDDDDLPPGFENGYFLNQSKVDFSHIYKIKWECPPLFVFSSHWLVAAGEESMEKDAQKLRDLRVLEAVYPRNSDIPPSPYVSVDVKEEDYDDNNTPLVPIIPIEEQEIMNILTDLAAIVNSLPEFSHIGSSNACVMPLSGISSGMDADLTAPSAAVAAIMKNNEQSRLIDMNLLVKIFNDPILIEKLIRQLTLSASSNAADTLISVLKAASRNTLTSTMGLLPSRVNPSMLNHTHDKPATASSAPLSWVEPFNAGKHVTRSVFHPAPTTQPAPHVFRSVNRHSYMSNGMLADFNTKPHPDPVLESRVRLDPTLISKSSSELSNASLPPATPSKMMYQPCEGSARAVKDVNYYKNLVREHGDYKKDSKIGTRSSNFKDLKTIHKQGQVKHKSKIPCIYFDSSRGCRNGNSCRFRHGV